MIRKLRKQLPSAILARGVAEVRRGSFRNGSKSRSEGRYVDVTQSEEGRSVPKRCDGLICILLSLRLRNLLETMARAKSNDEKALRREIESFNFRCRRS